MQNIHFDGNKIIVTNALRKIISDLTNENNYSDLNTEEQSNNFYIPLKKRFYKKYH